MTLYATARTTWRAFDIDGLTRAASHERDMGDAPLSISRGNASTGMLWTLRGQQ